MIKVWPILGARWYPDLRFPLPGAPYRMPVCRVVCFGPAERKGLWS